MVSVTYRILTATGLGFLGALLLCGVGDNPIDEAVEFASF